MVESKAEQDGHGGNKQRHRGGGMRGDKTPIRELRYAVSRGDGILVELGRAGEVDGAVPRRRRAGFLESIRG